MEYFYLYATEKCFVAGDRGDCLMAAADDNYACKLDARTAEKAKKELNEDPKDRLKAVDALRTWIQQQPHITFRCGQSYQSPRHHCCRRTKA